jgi:hypothetical protein
LDFFFAAVFGIDKTYICVFIKNLKTTHMEIIFPARRLVKNINARIFPKIWKRSVLHIFRRYSKFNLLARNVILFASKVKVIHAPNNLLRGLIIRIFKNKVNIYNIEK